MQSSLSTIIVTEQMVRDRLKEQKPGKSAGPDGIHSRVVVETQEQLVRPLTMIFNKSLKEGSELMERGRGKYRFSRKENVTTQVIIGQ